MTDTPKRRPLNLRQQRFVEEYLVDLNGQDAAIRAGYSPGRAKMQAYHLKQIPAVREAIDAAIQARSERVEANQDWIIKRLIENVQRAMQLVAVQDRGGKLTGEHSYQGSVANKALELLGKHLGMFTDKLKLEGDFLDNLSPDELAALVGTLREAGFGAPGEGESETRH